MRIYYFGELIQDTDNPTQTKKTDTVPVEVEQTKLAFEEVPQDKSGMQSIGEILQELDLTRDSFRSIGMRRTHA